MLAIRSVGAANSSAMASLPPILEGNTPYFFNISMRYVGVPLPNQ